MLKHLKYFLVGLLEMASVVIGLGILLLPIFLATVYNSYYFLLPYALIPMCAVYLLGKSKCDSNKRR